MEVIELTFRVSLELVSASPSTTSLTLSILFPFSNPYPASLCQYLHRLSFMFFSSFVVSCCFFRCYCSFHRHGSFFFSFCSIILFHLLSVNLLIICSSFTTYGFIKPEIADCWEFFSDHGSRKHIVSYLRPACSASLLCLLHFEFQFVLYVSFLEYCFAVLLPLLLRLFIIRIVR
jgi:hypothetical protein